MSKISSVSGPETGLVSAVTQPQHVTHFQNRGLSNWPWAEWVLGERCVSLVCSQQSSLERHRNPFSVNGLGMYVCMYVFMNKCTHVIIIY